MRMMYSGLAAIAALLSTQGPQSKGLVATVNSKEHHLSSRNDTYPVVVDTRFGMMQVDRPKKELGKKMYRANGDVFIMTRKGFHFVRGGHSKHHRSMVSA